MSIAQHSVAGEGDAHPSQAQQSVPADDDQALAEFTSDATNLPWVIFRATFRACHIDGLSTRARAVLAALARTVDAKHPYASIYARRDLLTDRSMQSMRTFYRSLADLEAAGLIRRPPQSRYVEAGLFGRAYLHLTEKAAILLGLVETRLVKTAEPDPDNAAPFASATSAHVHAHPSASMADGAIYKNLSPSSFQKRQPGQVPSDLERLRSLGFHEFLIFKLMKEAKQQGKLLSDVVAAVWQHLKAANRPINYLRKLLAMPVDFRQQRVVRQATIEAAQHAELEAQEIRAFLSRNEGKTFFDRATTRKITIGTDVSTMHDVTEAQPRAMAGSWQSGFVDALRNGQFIRATPELEEQFAEKRRQLQQSHQTANHTQPRVLTAAGGHHLGEALRRARMAAAGCVMRQT